MYINLRDPVIQMLANVVAIIIVEITIYRSKKPHLLAEKRPPRGWKEKLGIETTQDLLTFFVIMGVACSVTVTLVFASIGYIAPIPH